MLSADRLIHTQVINVKSLDVSKDVVIQMLLENAERIAQYIFWFIHSYEYRPPAVMNDL